MDEHLFKKKLNFYQEFIEADDETHEFWGDKDLVNFNQIHDDTSITIISGWYDFFLKQSVRDFQEFIKLKKNKNRQIKLIIMNVSHWDGHKYGSTMVEAFKFFDNKLLLKKKENNNIDIINKNEIDNEILEYKNYYLNKINNVDPYLINDNKNDDFNNSCVHCAIVGSKPLEWVSFTSWPPIDNIKQTKLFLNYDHKLSYNPPSIDNKNNYTDYITNIYDPNNKQLTVGGPSFDILNSGRIEQKKLEDLELVSVFESTKLTNSIDIIGKFFIIYRYIYMI